MKTHPTVMPWFLRSTDAAISLGMQHNILWGQDSETRAWLESLLTKYLSYAKSVFRAGEAVLYRGIKVQESRGEYIINFECIGKSWSRYSNTAGVYDPSPSMRGKTLNVILTGVAPLQSIDWENSLTWYLTDFEAMWEVRLGANKPIQITHLDGVELPEPIAANSGPSTLGNRGPEGNFLTWVEVCSLKKATRIKPPKGLQVISR